MNLFVGYYNAIERISGVFVRRFRQTAQHDNFYFRKLLETKNIIIGLKKLQIVLRNFQNYHATIKKIVDKFENYHKIDNFKRPDRPKRLNEKDAREIVSTAKKINK